PGYQAPGHRPRPRPARGPAGVARSGQAGPMEPIAEPIRMFGSTPDAEPLPWSWVDAQLTSAGTYWVVTHEDLDPEAMQYPHSRPVWGVWLRGGAAPRTRN